jgi:hypothetical protein
MPLPNLASKYKQHQTATLQAILQMVDDPNKPETAENNRRKFRSQTSDNMDR